MTADCAFLQQLKWTTKESRHAFVNLNDCLFIHIFICMFGHLYLSSYKSLPIYPSV
jgi:hypothetical protein